MTTFLYFITECPLYFVGPATLEESLIDSTMKTTQTHLEIMKGHVPFGVWHSQSITLQPFHNISEWYETVINVDSKDTISTRVAVCDAESPIQDYDFKRTNLTLPTDEAFISKVEVENEIHLCGGYIHRIILFYIQIC